jgi:hypothetical protein
LVGGAEAGQLINAIHDNTPSKMAVFASRARAIKVGNNCRTSLP